jgi:hypothetical protein
MPMIIVSATDMHHCQSRAYQRRALVLMFVCCLSLFVVVHLRDWHYTENVYELLTENLNAINGRHRA